jgi:hypothetical protein
MSSIEVRLDKVSKLLTRLSFNSFLSRNLRLLEAVLRQCPETAIALNISASPKKFFVEEFFRRRNKIMHYGHIDYGQRDAELCLSSAAALSQILTEMDSQRQRALEAQLK